MSVDNETSEPVPHNKTAPVYSRNNHSEIYNAENNRRCGGNYHRGNFFLPVNKLFVIATKDPEKVENLTNCSCLIEVKLSRELIAGSQNYVCRLKGLFNAPSN
jgi:hypothetical protein